MAEYTESKHFLNVTNDYGDEFDRWIEHLPDCPKEERGQNPLTGLSYIEYACGTGYWIEQFGLEDIKDDPRFIKPGRWEIGFYSYTPSSVYEDADAYIYFVEDE